MIPDDLEDFKDEIENVEAILVNMCTVHGASTCYQAMLRVISTMAVCGEEDKNLLNIKFQKAYEKFCELFLSIREN